MDSPSDSTGQDAEQRGPEGGRVRWWRRVRFGMRGLLVLVAVMAVVLARYANSVSRQREVVEEVKRRGGQVMYDYQWDHPVGAKTVQESPFPGWLVRAFGVDAFHHVTWIRIEDDTFGDDDLIRVFGVLDRVGTVGIAYCPITEKSVEFFAGYRPLWGLFLGGCSKVDDKAFENFSIDRLPRLSLIEVRGTEVSRAKGVELDKQLKAKEARLKAASGGRKIEAHFVLHDGPASRMYPEKVKKAGPGR